MAEAWAVTSILIGERFRRDLGDLDSLMESIQAVGLLHPVVVTAAGKLVAGQRRLEACKRLGWEEIPATVLSVSDPVCLLAEADENEVRRNLTPSEQVAVARFYSEQDRQEAEDRKRETQAKPGEKVGTRKGSADSAPPSKKGKARDKTAKRTGSGRSRLKQAEEVVAAAEEAPEIFADVVAKMDRTGNVNAALKETKKRQRAARRASLPDLPATTDRYQLICKPLAEVTAEEVPDNSVDWIITDPPYPKEFLPVYSDLSVFAERVLKPGGSLLAMVGQYHLPEVLTRLSESLSYHWLCAYYMPGGGNQPNWDRKVNIFWKPILWFTKGKYRGDMVADAFRSDLNDKQYHEWGQSESGMADIITKYTMPGQMICDPFVGGGTTGVVAIRLNRQFIGIDSDKDAIDTTLERLSVCQK
jgi:site-specific DNA-methyltransferase (adenine-specific)